jgi:uncharacterized membrane protein YgcG
MRILFRCIAILTIAFALYNGLLDDNSFRFGGVLIIAIIGLLFTFINFNSRQRASGSVYSDSGSSFNASNCSNDGGDCGGGGD